MKKHCRVTLARVKACAPNGYGLDDMVGNIWESCSDAITDPGNKVPGIFKASSGGVTGTVVD